MPTPRWKRAIVRRLPALGVWIAVVALWEAAFRTIGWKPWVFPAPSHILDSLLWLLNIRTGFGEPLGPGWPLTSPISPPPPLTGAASAAAGGVLDSPLVTALWTSLSRLALGFAAALALGVAAGLLLWRSAFLDSLLGPLFLGLQTLPSVCWVPLAVLTLGIDERGILFVLVMGSVFSTSIALRDGLRALPPVYRAAGTMLGARGARLYAHVLLPAAFPALAGTLRQGFAFAWRSLLGAELILMTTRRGLGFLLSAGRDFADVSQVVAMMAVMVAVGMAADRFVFAVVERRVRARFGLIPGG